MAWTVGEQLPEQLMPLLDGSDLEAKIGKAFLVVAVDEQGWPRCAMVSYGEVLALDAKTLRFSLWHRSSTTNHLRRTGKATVCLAEQQGVYYLKCDVADLGQALEEPIPLAKLEFRIREVLQDGDPDGDVTSGISYSSNVPVPEVLEKWQRQIEALREGSGR